MGFVGELERKFSSNSLKIVNEQTTCWPYLLP